MSNLIPFSFESKSIRVVVGDDGEPWFVAADVCEALTIANHRDAVAKLDDDEKDGVGITDAIGRQQETTIINESGLYALILTSRKPEAKKFKKWVTSEVLPAIRKTGGYAMPSAKPAKYKEVDAFKMVPAIVRAARALGLDKNAAAISANQVVLKLTGTNALQLLGHTHLEAEKQVLFFTPTDLGKRIGVSGRQLNLLLAEAGLQAKKEENWEPLPAADGLYRIFDTSKRHNSGTMVQQIKWAENVLSIISCLNNVGDKRTPNVLFTGSLSNFGG